jgi:hypothetical protein
VEVEGMSEQVEVRLTNPEIKHLLTLLDERLVDGSYYGNQVQYYARTRRVINKLENGMRKLGGSQ